MRDELANGLAGARDLQAQLREAKRREEELRETNAILAAKISTPEDGLPPPVLPPPSTAAAAATTTVTTTAMTSAKMATVAAAAGVGSGEDGTTEVCVFCACFCVCHGRSSYTGSFLPSEGGGLGSSTPRP